MKDLPVRLRHTKKGVALTKKMASKWRDLDNLNNDELWKQVSQLNNIKAFENFNPNFNNFEIQNNKFFKKLISYNYDELTYYDRKNIFNFIYSINLFIKEKFIINELVNLKKTIVDSITNQIVSELKIILEPIIMLEFNVAVKAGLLNQVNNKFEYFITNISNNKEWMEYFFEEYPSLLFYLENKILNITRSVALFIKRLDNDFFTIKKTFGITADDSLKEILLFLGDLHNLNHSVNKIIFNSKKILYYKPRKIEAELLYFNILNDLPVFWKSATKKYKSLVRKSYSWVSHIQYKYAEKTENIKQYYSYQGLNLALFYFLGTKDLINENIICSKNKPAFIDLECVISPKLKNHKKFARLETNAGKYLSNSVYSTGLLPRYISTDMDSTGFDDSGLAGFDISKNIGEAQFYNLPKLDNNTIIITEYYDTFIKSFLKGMYWVFNNKEVIKEIIKSNIDDKMKVRVLIRHTTVYDKLLTESFKPSYRKDSFEVDILFSNLYGYYDKNAFPASVIDSEIRQLWNNDIPYFYTTPNSKDIFAENGKFVSENFFQNSAYDSIIERIDNLCLEDIDKQKGIIEKSFILKGYLKNNLKILPKQKFKEEKNILDDKTILLREAEKIANKIINDAYKGKSLSWIDYSHSLYNDWELQSKSFDLYDGNTGIALFLIYLYKISGKQKYLNYGKGIIISMLSDYERTLNSKQFELNFITPYTYPAGILFALIQLNKISPVGNLNYYLTLFFNYVEKDMKTNNHSDFLLGIAGAVNFLIDIYKEFRSERALMLAKKGADILVDKAIKVSKTSIAWSSRKFNMLGGFSHGTSGIAYVFFRLHKYSSKNIYFDTALKALNYDRSLFDINMNSWRDIRYTNEYVYSHAWAHGSAGIGFSRVLISKYFNDEVLEKEIDIAKKNILLYGFDFDFSLVSGTFGNIEVLKHIANYQNDISLSKQINTYIINLLSNKTEDHNWWIQFKGTIINNLGLMTGIAGIGYNLLKFHSWEQVPSILNSEIK